jgi:hypothetical protein
MIARKHPIANWVRLPPAECRRTLDRVLQFRDAAPDPTASGLPEAAVTWFWESELPRLLTRPDVRKQAIRAVTGVAGHPAPPRGSNPDASRRAAGAAGSS